MKRLIFGLMLGLCLCMGCNNSSKMTGSTKCRCCPCDCLDCKCKSGDCKCPKCISRPIEKPKCCDCPACKQCEGK